MPILLGQKFARPDPTGPNQPSPGTPKYYISLPPPDPILWQGDNLLAIQGTGLSQPRGIDVVLEYNGLTMNDRKVVDKYRITELNGLSDADVRTSNEPNPSDHGETPLNGFYGGRTLVMTGRIESTSISRLRDMQQALKSAFMDLIERPLIFRTSDGIGDIFIMCRKSTLIEMREIQNDFRPYRDFMLTLRASNPRFLSYNKKNFNLIFALSDDFNSSNPLTSYDVI